MATSEVISVDAHSHLYPCFDTCTFLERAYSNLSEAATKFSDGIRPTCVLFLLSTTTGNGFHQLHEAFKRETRDTGVGTGNWQLQTTEERVSMCLNSDQRSLVAISGHQAVSQEGLEVLALGTRQQFNNGKSTEILIREVAQDGAIPVLPWGVGKWLGKRAGLVEDLTESSTLPQFFLGDSANRPSFWPRPSQFRRAEERGIRNLPGSDPLPFPDEVQRVGSFGVLIEGALDLEKPAQHLKQLLLDSSIALRQFGHEETPVRFVRNQLKMQLRKFT